jgi:F-type H+-transporting ATPase subunit b
MPVAISIPTMVVEFLIFLVALFMMERFVFDPIRGAWAERDRRIQAGLASSTDSRQEAERAREAVHQILNDARRQAQAEIDQAAAAGGKTRDQMVAQATEEFHRLVDEARGEIGAERERTAAALRGNVVDIALLAASRVTGQSFAQPQVRELAAAVVQREGLR